MCVASLIVVTILSFFSFATVLFISWRYSGFRINLNISNVYVLRSEARNYNFPIILKYLFGWTRILNAIFFCLSLLRKKKVMATLYFINQILSFGIDGMKSSMFIILVDLIIYILYRLKIYSDTFNLLSLGFIIISALTLCEVIFLKTIWLLSLMSYRMEFLPVRISSLFYDFFTKNEPDYFRSSFLRLFGFKSPYEKIDFMISGIYSGNYNLAANNGLISDAITNMSYAGIIVMPMILVAFLRFFDRCSHGINDYLVLTLGLFYSITLSNMFFLPNLLTGGGIVAILIVLFINRERTEKLS